MHSHFAKSNQNFLMQDYFIIYHKFLEKLDQDVHILRNKNRAAYILHKNSIKSF